MPSTFFKTIALLSLLAPFATVMAADDQLQPTCGVAGDAILSDCQNLVNSGCNACGSWPGVLCFHFSSSGDCFDAWEDPNGGEVAGIYAPDLPVERRIHIRGQTIPRNVTRLD
ncbi:hypothetical protein C8F01DRAFT_1084510 [Mycena amicta]|nr:hypothetical protein C8F01DRAFT_1084510 [Mycena amicta]